MQKHTDRDPESMLQHHVADRRAHHTGTLTTRVAHGRHRMGRLVGLSAPLIGRFSRMGWPSVLPYAWAFANRPSTTP